jgi:hypothetical protein
MSDEGGPKRKLPYAAEKESKQFFNELTLVLAPHPGVNAVLAYSPRLPYRI